MTSHNSSFQTPTKTDELGPALLDDYDDDSLKVFINRLSEAELRHELKEAYKLVKQKDRECESRPNEFLDKFIDLVTVAEIGQTLIERNNALAAENKALLHTQSFFNTQGDFTSTTSLTSLSTTKLCNNPAHETLAASTYDAERACTELEREIEGLNEEKQEAARLAQRKYKKILESFESAKRDLEREFLRSEGLEEEKKRLVKEKAVMAKNARAPDANDAIMEEMQNKNYELEGIIKTLRAEKQEMENRYATATKESAILKDRCIQYQEQLEDHQSLKESYEDQNIQLGNLTLAFEESRETVDLLNAQLSMLIPKSEEGPDHAGVTLFSEVEDRRKELEDKNVYLSQRHVDLLKAHSLSVHQQERMKNHILRLTQLSNDHDNHDRLCRLEVALGQSESENKFLHLKLLQLQKSQQTLGPLSIVNGDATFYEANWEVVEMLREQLTENLGTLRKELRTVQMLRLSEAEKTRATERLLYEREKEIERLRAENAQFKFELSEAKFKIRTTSEGGMLGEFRLDEDNNTGVKKENTLELQTQSSNKTDTQQQANISLLDHVDKDVQTTLKIYTGMSLPVSSSTQACSNEILVSNKLSIVDSLDEGSLSDNTTGVNTCTSSSSLSQTPSKKRSADSMDDIQMLMSDRSSNSLKSQVKQVYLNREKVRPSECKQQ